MEEGGRHKCSLVPMGGVRWGERERSFLFDGGGETEVFFPGGGRKRSFIDTQEVTEDR